MRLNIIFSVLSIVLPIKAKADVTFYDMNFQGKGEYRQIHLKGEVKVGDHQALLKAVQVPYRVEIILGSQGGNVYEGLRIADFVQRLSIPIIVPNNHICLSICAVMWLSADPKYRIIGKNALLGTHSAWFTNEIGQTIPSAVGNKIIAEYLVKRGYSKKFVSFLLSAPPEQMNWIEFDDLKKFGLSFHYLLN
jgi:ATP-dependent protease ClpP protease subunit